MVRLDKNNINGKKVGLTVSSVGYSKLCNPGPQFLYLCNENNKEPHKSIANVILSNECNNAYKFPSESLRESR